MSPAASATPATTAMTVLHPSSDASAAGVADGDVAGSGEPVPASLQIASDVETYRSPSGPTWRSVTPAPRSPITSACASSAAGSDNRYSKRVPKAPKYRSPRHTAHPVGTITSGKSSTGSMNGGSPPGPSWSGQP